MRFFFVWREEEEKKNFLHILGSFRFLPPVCVDDDVSCKREPHESVFDIDTSECVSSFEWSTKYYGENEFYMYQIFE